MKKILALALVLVLAIGMMVPASAKVQVDKYNPLGTNYIEYVGDINPDWSKTYRLFGFDELTLSSDALTALGATTTLKSFQGVMNKIADSVGVKIRARKGGAILTVEVQDPKFVGVMAAADITLPGWLVLPAPSTTNLASVGNYETWLNTFPAYVALTTAQKDDYFDAYGAAVWSLYDDMANWDFIIKLEAPEIPWVNVSDVDFEVDVLLHIDGRSDNDLYWTYTGNLSNEVLEIDADNTFANAYDGHIIKATEYVPKVAICGNYDDDVYAHVKMAKDKKIFFVALTNGEIKDEPIFDKYPAIEWAYTIYQSGLNSYSGNFIELGGVDSTYYVYGKAADGTLKYLGRGGELLPLSAKYYISSAKLDLDDEVVEDDVEVPEVEDEVSFNPSTGI